ncbi:MAG: ABC transporter ATP-binding protein [Bacteroidales bacterium]|nr:ABC transporter ATP-binding protein [Bacteroidales bacterium]
MNKENIIEIKNLSISFRKDKSWNEVIHNADLSVRRGEITAIVGESGSGKSVSSLAIMGLLDKKITKINSGEILFYPTCEGTETKKENNGGETPIHLEELSQKGYQKIRGKKIAMIFQEPMTALNPVKRCGKQVDEMICTHLKVTGKEAKAMTLALFREVLLPNEERIYNAYPFELSGGQRQRVMIAMALSCKPELLIADEPTTALDVTVQKSILSLISSLQKKYGMSVIFISHDLGLVNSIADNVIVIYQGRIIEQGKCNAVFTNPKQAYTKGLIASRPPMDYKPERLLSVKDFLSGEKPVVKIISHEQTLEERKLIYSQAPLLEVKNLEIEYTLKRNIFSAVTKSFKAVSNVSFNVYKGETLGLVGESGCGKTSLGKAVVQLIKQNSGDVIFKGRSLSSLPSKEKYETKKQIQIIFQDPYSSLNPRKTIGRTIEEPMEVYRLFNKSERRDKSLELLSKVGLNEDFYFRYPHELSGGQRQRVGIARALSLEPELIVCDESVSALDVSVQAQVLNLLNDLKKDYGFAYIFISHDLGVVKYMSDRIIVMQKGQIAEENYPEEIYNNPQEEYTKKLISSIRI